MGESGEKFQKYTLFVSIGQARIQNK